MDFSWENVVQIVLSSHLEDRNVRSVSSVLPVYKPHFQSLHTKESHRLLLVRHDEVVRDIEHVLDSQHLPGRYHHHTPRQGDEQPFSYTLYNAKLSVHHSVRDHQR